MRSDVVHLSACGKESAYHCKMQRLSDSHCHMRYEGCKYIPKTCSGPKDRNPIHPLSIELTGLFVSALADNLLNTAWCIDLARTAMAYELIAEAEGKSNMFVMNKIREKIEKDKGVLIR